MYMHCIKLSPEKSLRERPASNRKTKETGRRHKEGEWGRGEGGLGLVTLTTSPTTSPLLTLCKTVLIESITTVKEGDDLIHERTTSIIFPTYFPCTSRRRYKTIT